MEIYKRSERPAPGQPGRVILELETPERNNVPTILYDNGHTWVPFMPFPSLPVGGSRHLREDMVWTYAQDSFRNLLVDGGCEVWQGSRNQALPFSGSYLGCDMWWGISNTVPTDYTVSRQSGIVAGSRYCLRAQRNAGSTDTDGITVGIDISPDQALMAAGKRVIVSFSVRVGANFSCDLGGGNNFAVALFSGTTLNQPSRYGYTGVAKVANGFFLIGTNTTRITVTGVVGSNAQALALWIGGASTVGTAGAADYYEIDDVQVEISDVASLFERLPFDVVYARVQHLYRKSFPYDTAPANAAGLAGAHRYTLLIGGAVASVATSPVQFPAMRQQPSVQFYNPVNNNAFVYNSALGTDATATTSQYDGDKSFGILQTGLAAWAAGNGLAVHYELDARIN